MEGDIKFGHINGRPSKESEPYNKLLKRAEMCFDFVQSQKDCMKMDKQSFCAGYMNAFSLELSE